MLFETEGDEVVSFAMNNWRGLHEFMGRGYRPGIHIVTKGKKYYLILREPEEILQINVPEEFNSNLVAVATTKDGIFLRYIGAEGMPSVNEPKLINEWAAKYRNKARKQWIEFYQVDGSGNLRSINRFDWLTHEHRKKMVYEAGWDWNSITSEYVRFVSSPAIPLALKLYFKLFYSREKLEMFINHWTIQVFRRYMPLTWGLMWGLSFLMACVVFWHGWCRRSCWGRFLFWVVFVGLFNLAGLLTYLGLNHTPVIHCGFCGKRRGLETVDCPRCKAELAVPERRDVDLIMAV